MFDMFLAYFKMTKTVKRKVYPKIVDCARMVSSSVRKRRSSADGCRPRKFGEGLRVVRANPKACALRAPTTSKFFGYTPSEKFERGFSGKQDALRIGF
jgi:hypothetical protein